MSLKFSAAIIKENDCGFAVVLVKTEIVRNLARARMVSAGCSTVFVGTPIVLAAQDSAGRFSFHGRKELIVILRNLEPKRLMWKRYTLSDRHALDTLNSSHA